MRMKQVTILCAGLVSLLHVCWADAVCQATDTQKSNVISLAINMARSVGPCVTPDPSVLLALNLGQIKDVYAQDLLVTQLKEDAAQKINHNETFSSGKVALYVLALRSSCADPTVLPNCNGNLVQLLENKTQEELDRVDSHGSPLTTWYQVGLDVLALCVMSQPSAITVADAVAKVIPTNPSGHTFSVDTAAVAVMGFTCVLEMEGVPQNTHAIVKHTLGELLNMILDAQDNGLIGNIYSTGLAGQALTATKSFYPTQRWDCPKTLTKMVDLIPQKKFSLPIAAAQLLPFLWGKSYVSVKDISCPSNGESSHSWRKCSWRSKGKRQETCEDVSLSMISVEFTIVNDLGRDDFKYSIIVTVEEESNVLQVMEKAAELNPKHFSFQTESSSWGAFVTAINNLKGSTNDKTYWQFFSGATPLSVGVSSYKPHNNEHILAIFSTY